MIALLFVLVLSVGLAVALAFLLGFRLGGQPSITETHRVQAEAAAAERELHDLTRSAFVAMAEAAQRQRSSRGS